jgi:hypothetical protein
MKRSVLRWELLGIIFISLLGAVLHFAFEWSGGWRPLGVIAAVNESVWEHFKIGFWPALFYAFLGYGCLRRLTDNYVVAKAAGIYVIPTAIAAIFYSYTAILGQEILIVDILIFVVAIALGQLTSYKILTLNRLPEWLSKVGLIMIILLGIVFGVFTFYPPHLSLFRDAVTGAFGIPH